MTEWPVMPQNTQKKKEKKKCIWRASLPMWSNLARPWISQGPSGFWDIEELYDKKIKKGGKRKKEMYVMDVIPAFSDTIIGKLEKTVECA